VSAPLTELDAIGEAMVCEGCGTTKTVAAILERHGPQAIACCPERKMVAARFFWLKANADIRLADIRLDGPTLRFCVRYLRRQAAAFKQSRRGAIKDTLNDAADSLLAFDEMFGDRA
jgi:hypothetical protein